MTVVRRMSADIVEFHLKFGLTKPERPQMLTEHLKEFRAKFLQEELDELRKAFAEDSLPDALDALVDLVYVAIGTAYLMNLPFDSAWDAVHAANMKKVRAERAGDSKRGSTFDVVKPPGWTAPDMQVVLDAHEKSLDANADDGVEHA